jgi:hypothetical protein
MLRQHSNTSNPLNCDSCQSDEQIVNFELVGFCTLVDIYNG